MLVGVKTFRGEEEEEEGGLGGLLTPSAMGLVLRSELGELEDLRLLLAVPSSLALKKERSGV